MIENSLSRELEKEWRIENLEKENATLRAQLDKITRTLTAAGVLMEK